jgi:hypothetical protein
MTACERRRGTRFSRGFENGESDEEEEVFKDEWRWRAEGEGEGREVKKRGVRRLCTFAGG